MNNIIKNIISPFGKIDKKTGTIVLISQIMLVGLILELFSSDQSVFPKPSDVLDSLESFLGSQSFYDNLIASVMFIGKGLLISILVTMPICYLWTIPFFKPFVNLVTKLRYLTFSCVIFIFTMSVSTLEELKMLILIFGIIPFFTTSLVSILSAIPEQQINKAFINKKNNWGALYEIVIVGKLDQVFEIMRQNFAIAWAMITTAEGYTMAGGGIGTMIIKSNKHMHIADVFAIGIIVVTIGIVFDYLLSSIRTFLFQYIQKRK